MNKLLIHVLFLALILSNVLTIPLFENACIQNAQARSSEHSYIEYFAGDYGNLNAAVKAIGKTTATLVISTPSPLTDNLTIPANILVKMPITGSINRGAYNLIINGPFECGLYKVFNGTGTVTFGNGSVKEVFPQWWGARQDGISDDTIAIQSALSSFYTTKLVAGVYVVSSPLHLAKNKFLSGAGRESTIIKGSGDLKDAVVIMYSNTSLENITTDANNIEALSGVHISAAKGAKIREVRATNAKFHGIALTDSSYCTIENIETDHCYYRGVLVDPNSSYNQISKIYSHDNGAAGILIGHNSNYNTVSDFTIENIGNCGVWIHNASHDNKIINGIIRSPTKSTYPGLILALNSYNNSISNVSIYGHNRGVLLRAGSTDTGYASGNTRQNSLSNLLIQGNGSNVLTSTGVMFESTDGGVSKCSNNVFNNIIISGFENGFTRVNNGAIDTNSNVIESGDVSIDVKYGWRFEKGGTNNGNNRIIHLNGYTPADQSKQFRRSEQYVSDKIMGALLSHLQQNDLVYSGQTLYQGSYFA